MGDTIKGFSQILNGELDDIPTPAFYMVGSIQEVHEKAEKMASEGKTSDDDTDAKSKASAEAAVTGEDVFAHAKEARAELEKKQKQYAVASKHGEIEQQWKQWESEAQASLAGLKQKEEAMRAAKQKKA